MVNRVSFLNCFLAHQHVALKVSYYFGLCSPLVSYKKVSYKKKRVYFADHGQFSYLQPDIVDFFSMIATSNRVSRHLH